MSSEAYNGDLLSVQPQGPSVYLATSKDDSFLRFATHMSSKESVRIFGDTVTEKSVEDEVLGLVDRNAVSPVDQSNFD